MNAYLTYDRIEAQDWTQHYQQIARRNATSLRLAMKPCGKLMIC